MQVRQVVSSYSVVQSHNSKEAGIWVTYKDGIYDITDFMIGHPGGDKILLAAGSSVEPFWDLYAIHRSPEVYEILESLRIGNLHPEDKVARPAVNPNDPYKHDPARHPALKVNSAKPFNAEAPGSLLADNFITPNDLFFVRNHLPVPKVDPKKFRLQVGGKQFALEDLKQKFKQHSVIATVQCAGNRRSELSKLKAVNGLSWSHAAISNAEWTGVLLSDLLTSAGINGEDYKHCILQGLDTDGEGNPYEASIPMETASDPKKEAIVAFEMNGQELPLDHGFPLRVIVPGTVGARQVKWVKMISASQEESYSHWQRKDYMLFSPSTGHDTADYDKAVAIQEYPTQSAICEPRNGATIEGSEVTLRGYAWSGGGRGIMRVEVTPDGGKTWYEADMHGDEQQKRHQQWAWVLWEVAVPVPDGASDMSIACRAIDSSHNSQPEKLESVWNIRGLINNAWHHINLKVDNED
ncbi:hypothetical protein CAPTEDRAFT_17949 [Capitella teleta]|uniref:Sulfite oxidase n=1 Tax=Capitella teleta TaxID=283909 RepID=R7UCQ4_CAPTE|nr:hypothetical protein CAPTEDRAFT_17949 [Capitella teleta]|eukprot:ELU04165.1 hypothetical protein CAPTEDRAFT_17949 [Capitella teleta]